MNRSFAEVRPPILPLLGERAGVRASLFHDTQIKRYHRRRSSLATAPVVSEPAKIARVAFQSRSEF